MVAAKQVTLAEMSPGEDAVVYRITGGGMLRERLTAMGIYEGVAVRVLRGGCGGLLVAAGEARLGLGRGMAQKVLVQPTGEGCENG